MYNVKNKQAALPPSHMQIPFRERDGTKGNIDGEKWVPWVKEAQMAMWLN